MIEKYADFQSVSAAPAIKPAPGRVDNGCVSEPLEDMGDSKPPLRKHPLSSLATKIIFVVFLATFLTAVVVSWISVHSTYGFLRGQIDQEFPALLARTAQRIERWLGEGCAELERLATSAEVRDMLHGDSPAGNRSDPLGAALERTQHFQALVLLDAAGVAVAVAGPEAAPSPSALRGCLAALSADAVVHATGHSTAVAAIPVGAGSERRPGTLCGVYQERALAEMLTAGEISPSAEMVLIDGIGRIQFSSGEPGTAKLALSAARTSGAAKVVQEYRNHAGEHVVGAALPLVALDWTLIVEQPLQEAFEPVFSVMTRVFVIDLCIILLFSFLAYQVTATVVHPIEALSEGALRISRGELDVEIPNTKGSDEIGLLTRTFNDMTRKLLHHRTEIQEVNRKLLAQNHELQRVNEVLEQLSITDGLTKLHNHRFFQEHLTREIKRVSRSSEPLSLLLLDIDDFKQLNDRFGHLAGDELLVRLSQILNDSMRDTDLIARYGGEEFAVLAANTDLEGAVNLGEKIRTAVAETAFIVGDSMRPTGMTVSIGVAQFHGSRKELLRETDRALYRAKADGKNCVVAENPDGDDVIPDRFEQEA
jgi:diguanylate cyclase (GGDEF)-like protein